MVGIVISVLISGTITHIYNMCNEDKIYKLSGELARLKEKFYLPMAEEYRQIRGHEHVRIINDRAHFGRKRELFYPNTNDEVIELDKLEKLLELAKKQCCKKVKNKNTSENK